MLGQMIPDTEVRDYAGSRDSNERQIEIRSQILSWYRSGRPLFTRESIASFAEQLASVQAGQRVSFRGLDGNVVESTIRTGEVVALWHPSSDEEVLTVFVQPFIDYVSIQRLLDIERMKLPRVACCSLRLLQRSWPCDHDNHAQLPKVEFTAEKELGMLFGSTIEAWEACEAGAQLSCLLQSKDILRGIRKLVAFACGSMAYGAGLSIEPSLRQHALILTIQDIVAKMTDSAQVQKIPCFAQDPAYIPESDISVLKGKGITVLEDPQGFLAVDSTTAVISCSPNVPVRQIVMDLTLPLLMIWDHTQERSDYNAKGTDPSSPRMEAILEKYYDTSDFPGKLDSFDNFRWLTIFVRKREFGTVSEDGGHLPVLDG